MKDSEIRKHYYLERYVIIAPKRAKRPHKILKVEHDEEEIKNCFFCPKQLDKQKSVYKVSNGKKGWLVKVVDNKFPALTLNNPKAYGKQEVVIDTPEHGKEIHELSVEHIVKIIDTYIERNKTLSKIEGINYVLIFKNEGGKAGASVPHSHSQIYALPVVPPMVEEETLAIEKYIIEKGSCPHCDIIKGEINGPRVAWEDENFIVICPFASRNPYGSWFMPKRHVANIDDLHIKEKESLAKAMKHILGKLDSLDISYNYFFHDSLSCEDQHMVLKLAPRPNVWAGLELGTGIIINPVPPEDAAKFYKKD